MFKSRTVSHNFGAAQLWCGDIGLSTCVVTADHIDMAQKWSGPKDIRGESGRVWREAHYRSESGLGRKWSGPKAVCARSGRCRHLARYKYRSASAVVKRDRMDWQRLILVRSESGTWLVTSEFGQVPVEVCGFRGGADASFWQDPSCGSWMCVDTKRNVNWQDQQTVQNPWEAQSIRHADKSSDVGGPATTSSCHAFACGLWSCE